MSSVIQPLVYFSEVNRRAADSLLLSLASEALAGIQNSIYIKILHRNPGIVKTTHTSRPHSDGKNTGPGYSSGFYMFLSKEMAQPVSDLYLIAFSMGSEKMPECVTSARRSRSLSYTRNIWTFSRSFLSQKNRLNHHENFVALRYTSNERPCLSRS